jgi:hypothetical protein
LVVGSAATPVRLASSINCCWGLYDVVYCTLHAAL